MSISIMKQALEALETEQAIRQGYSYRGGVRVVSTADEAINALRAAIQQAQQPATATACGIPGMAKTTCPYCDQEFAFEQPATPDRSAQVFYDADGGDNETGVGYHMKPYVHWFNKALAAAAAADTKLYTHTAPSVPDDVVRAKERRRFILAAADDMTTSRYKSLCELLGVAITEDFDLGAAIDAAMLAAQAKH